MPDLDPFSLSRPTDPGTDPNTMSPSAIDAAIAEHRGFLRSQTSTTPESIKRQARLDTLLDAQRRQDDAAASGPSRGASSRRKVKGRTPRSESAETTPAEAPERPRSLGSSLDVSKMTPRDIRDELDRVIAYLAAGPSASERAVLELALPSLRQAASAASANEQEDKRRARLVSALSPTGGAAADQLISMLRRLQDLHPHPSEEGVWVLREAGEIIPVATAEAETIRAKVIDGLVRSSGGVNGLLYDVELAWSERHQKNRRQKVVHGLVKFATGVEDIPASDIARMTEVSGFYHRTVCQLAGAGQLVKAGEKLLEYDGIARHWAKRVGTWEAELVEGAGRWVFALEMAKVGLSTLAGLGVLRLASAGSGGLMGSLTTGAKITGATTTVGAVSGAVGAEVAGRDGVEGLRRGGAAGFDVGSGALTGGISKAAAIKNAGSATGALRTTISVARTAAVETGLNVATNAASAAIAGDDVGSAALGAAVSTPVTLAGRSGVRRVARNRGTEAAGNIAVGSVAAATGAAVTGGDVTKNAIFGTFASVINEAAAVTTTTGDTGSSRPRSRADDVGKRLDKQDLATRYGMPKKNVDKIGAIANDEKVLIDIRPTSEHAEPRLRQGSALPKHEKVKAKTIDEIDIMIGIGTTDDLGLAAFPRPRQMRYPEGFDTMAPDLQQKIEQRMSQRLEEISDYAMDMRKLVAAGEIEIRPDGIVINKTLEPGRSGMPFTGDHDIFDIRGIDDTELTRAQYKRIVDRLVAADVGVKHGAVTWWAQDSPESYQAPGGQESYAKMMGTHSAGGREPLVRFGDGSPIAVWYRPARPRSP